MWLGAMSAPHVKRLRALPAASLGLRFGSGLGLGLLGGAVGGAGSLFT